MRPSSRKRPLRTIPKWEEEEDGDAFSKKETLNDDPTKKRRVSKECVEDYSLATLRRLYGAHNHWYIPFVAKTSKTRQRTTNMNAIQWLRWSSQNSVVSTMLWMDMTVLAHGWVRKDLEDIDMLSIGEALSMYHWADKMEVSSRVTSTAGEGETHAPLAHSCVEESKCNMPKLVQKIKTDVVRFFRKFWHVRDPGPIRIETHDIGHIELMFLGIRSVFSTPVKMYSANQSLSKGIVSTTSITLGKLLLSSKFFKGLVEQIECHRIYRLKYVVKRNPLTGIESVAYVQGKKDCIVPVEYTKHCGGIAYFEGTFEEKIEKEKIRQKGHRIVINRVKQISTFRRNYEFPPDKPHSADTLKDVLVLVAPWLLNECVRWPRVRGYVYPAIIACKTFMLVFKKCIERMIYQKMIEEFPSVIDAFPDIWKSTGDWEGDEAFQHILADKEAWPGHWRTIGRVLEMKGLCRGNSACSLVDTPVALTYSEDRIAWGTDPRVTNTGPSKRWNTILPISKALNLFEVHIRLRNSICFECGAMKDNPSEVPVFVEIRPFGMRLFSVLTFVVQTDVFGGKVYACCPACIDRGSLIQEKRSCDSIPYCLTDGGRMFVLTPYIEMIKLDYELQDKV